MVDYGGVFHYLHGFWWLVVECLGKFLNLIITLLGSNRRYYPIHSRVIFERTSRCNFVLFGGDQEYFPVHSQEIFIENPRRMLLFSVVVDGVLTYISEKYSLEHLVIFYVFRWWPRVTFQCISEKYLSRKTVVFYTFRQ